MVETGRDEYCFACLLVLSRKDSCPCSGKGLWYNIPHACLVLLAASGDTRGQYQGEELAADEQFPICNGIFWGVFA